MTKLRSTLARLGAAQLATMLGEPTTKLLEVLDERNLANNKLAELVIRQIGPEDLLLNRSTRREILTALPQTEAEQLSRMLKMPAGMDTYSYLSQLNFRRGQTNTKILFNFFGCEAPTEESKNARLSEKIVPSAYPVFPHQRHAYREVLQYLTQGNPPRVLLHMPTGSGKTRTAMSVIASMLREKISEEEVVVWLAHSEELCDQAAEEFEKSWAQIGDRAINVYRHFGPYRLGDLALVRSGFLIAGIALLYQHSLTYSSSFFELARRTSLVVMDEAHHAVAPTYKHLLNLIAPGEKTPILGLSATPGRSLLDAGEDLKLANFFGRQKVTLRVEGFENPVEYLVQEGYLAKAEYVRLPYSSVKPVALTETEIETLRTSFDLPERVIKGLARDHMRNLLILNHIMSEANKGAKILVFACSVEHAILLANLLRVKGYKCAAVTSRTSTNTRRDVINQYRDTDEVQILTNYGVLTTGFDAPRTNVAIITRPTNSVVLYSQMVGRAARGPKVGGNQTCRILTVADNIPGFRNIDQAFTFWEDIWTE